MSKLRKKYNRGFTSISVLTPSQLLLKLIGLVGSYTRKSIFYNLKIFHNFVLLENKKI